MPPTDLAIPDNLETATFGMGCFWRPEALFGSIPGVVRTRVGYAGGSTDNPTYRTLSDHIEIVQLDYDPAKVSYNELLHLFFSSHTATRAPWKRQYTSAIFYHTLLQEQLAQEALRKQGEQLGQNMFTKLKGYKVFYLAEERHQKYKLQRHPLLLEEIKRQYRGFTDFNDSTVAALANGYLGGYGNRGQLQQQVTDFGLSAAAQEMLLQKCRA